MADSKLDACAARLDALDSRLGNLEAQAAADRVSARGDAEKKTPEQWRKELDDFNDQRVFPLSMADYKRRMGGG